MKSPIFIFSLPRSGSTLLQRILMSHKDIASVAEPWLLLPLLYADKENGIISEYSQALSGMAIQDFENNLPNQKQDYYDALNIFAHTLYEKQCHHEEIYFLDKTPRYYFIIPEIAKVFPNAKFIFLFRNPIHVMSSIIQTWGNGHLHNLYQYESDLHIGPKALSEGYLALKDKAYAIQYERFVTNPEKYTKEICTYLDIEYDESVLYSFNNQDTKGRMGDPTGVFEYSSVSSNSLDKWKKTFNTSFRKNLLKKYIESIDVDAFSVQGYSKSLILDEIATISTINAKYFQDRCDYFFSLLMKQINLKNHQLLIGKFSSSYSRIQRFMSIKRKK